jgi:hypothetical protein
MNELLLKLRLKEIIDQFDTFTDLTINETDFIAFRKPKHLIRSFRKISKKSKNSIKSVGNLHNSF